MKMVTMRMVCSRCAGTKTRDLYFCATCSTKTVPNVPMTLKTVTVTA